MKASSFNLEKHRLKEEITKRGAKRVLIQLPEGLKPQGPKLAAIAEKAGALAIISVDPCYGACDLAVQETENLGADLLIHYGHSELEPKSLPIVYIEARSTLRVKTTVKEALPMLKPWRHIGLVTTVQHLDMLAEARTQLLEVGKSVMVGDAGRLKYAGQVIGCDYSNANAVSKDVDAFLFIGGGRFHALGVALATLKPTVVADPYERRAFAISDLHKIIRQRWASIQEAEKAAHCGILIGLKNGQKRLGEAMQLKEKLEKIGKKATLMGVREVTPESLIQFPTIDAFVNTACPRIALDDASKFHKPVLTLNETRVLVGELTWEELCRRGWFES